MFSGGVAHRSLPCQDEAVPDHYDIGRGSDGGATGVSRQAELVTSLRPCSPSYTDARLARAGS